MRLAPIAAALAGLTLTACGSQSAPHAASTPSRPPSAVATHSAALVNTTGCKQIAVTIEALAKHAKSSPYGIVQGATFASDMGSSGFQQELYADSQVKGISPSLRASELALGTDGSKFSSDVYSGKISAIKGDEAAVKADIGAIAKDCATA